MEHQVEVVVGWSPFDEVAEELKDRPDFDESTWIDASGGDQAGGLSRTAIPMALIRPATNAFDFSRTVMHSPAVRALKHQLDATS